MADLEMCYVYHQGTFHISLSVSLDVTGFSSKQGAVGERWTDDICVRHDNKPNSRFFRHCANMYYNSRNSINQGSQKINVDAINRLVTVQILSLFGHIIVVPGTALIWLSQDLMILTRRIVKWWKALL